MMFWLIFFIILAVMLFAAAGLWFLYEVGRRTVLLLKVKAGQRVYDPALYHTLEWKALRQRVIESNGGKCAWCGAKAQTAHHISYRRGVLSPSEDLVPVCWKCHKAIHAIKEQSRWN